MNTSSLVGIHLGTSSVQVGVYDLDGNVLESGSAPINEQTTATWERALREATPPLPDRGICSVAGTSGTALLVDEYGEPVFPPQMYFESVPEDSDPCRQLALEDPPFGWNIVTSPNAPLSKIIHLRNTYPDRFQDVEWIVSPATWLLYRLCYSGSSRWRDLETDWSNAMKFGTDVTAAVPTWFEEIFETTALSRSLFPTIQPPGSYIGVAQSKLAERTGFDGIKLFQGLTDGSAAVLASGCLEPGDFSVTFSAASVIKYVSSSIEPHDALYYHRHPIEGYLPGAAFDSGNVLRWFFDRVLDCSTERGLELARSVDDEYDVFLPGNRSPFFDPAIGSSILGIDPDTSLATDEVHGRIARGLTTSIVLSEWTYISLIEEHFDATIDRIRVMNDGAPNVDGGYDWWNERRASIWNRPVVEMEPRITLGPIIPPALITSKYTDSTEATERLLRRRATVRPDTDDRGDYVREKETYLDRWRQIASLSSPPDR
ncbi:FGGY family carbohydrate kinase [Natrarchaeobius chitinivorans]|uniref:Xylulose kinase n=1 Tax=Natrarchaeobius chitinivorans TaxID=1679083 RepID=A0A3N6PAU1_NATCH|nr:FGGY family carbohydrate kinase [Natrarchaeobius chitinivorans]RQG93565.1 xylulose kinase [Natrarchaeobius chitinivorans]